MTNTTTTAPGYAIAAAGGDIPSRLRRDLFTVTPLPGGAARVARQGGGYEVLLAGPAAAKFNANQAAHLRGLAQVRKEQADRRRQQAAASFARRTAGDQWEGLDKIVP